MNTTLRILLLIKEKNINDVTFCRECKLSNGAVTDWKKGKAKPSTDAIVKIAKYFDVSTDYLLGLTEDRNIYYKKSND